MNGELSSHAKKILWIFEAYAKALKKPWKRFFSLLFCRGNRHKKQNWEENDLIPLGVENNWENKR